MAAVTAPVKGFTGTVAGVMFVDGRASTGDRVALAYFRRAGYLVTEDAEVTEEAKAEPSEVEKGKKR